MMHASTLHTPTWSNISAVSPALLSLSLSPLSPSLPLSLPPSSSFCSFRLRDPLSLSLSPLRADSAEVSAEMQSQLHFSSPTHGQRDLLMHLSEAARREEVGISH